MPGGEYSRNVAGSLALKISSVGLTFLTSILLVRLLGRVEYGYFVYSIAWMQLLVTLALLGFEKLLVRLISVYNTRESWGLMRGLIRRSNQIILAFAVGIAVIAAGISWWWFSGSDMQMVMSLSIAMLSLPLAALMRLRLAVMQGLHKVFLGQLPESAVKPVLFLGLIGLTYLLSRDSLDAPHALLLFLLSLSVALFVGVLMLLRALPELVNSAVSLTETNNWIKAALPLLLVSGFAMLHAQAEVLILVSVAGPGSLAGYHVAKRISEFIPLVFISVNLVLSPAVARLYAKNEMERLQRLVTKNARLVLLLALPAALVFIFYGRFFLALFGPEFIDGETILTVLTIGQLLNILLGSVGLLLIMTGHSGDAVRGIGISAILNVSLSFSLIPVMGNMGAAVAFTSSLIVGNLFLSFRVWKRLGLHATALGRFWNLNRRNKD